MCAGSLVRSLRRRFAELREEACAVLSPSISNSTLREVVEASASTHCKLSVIIILLTRSCQMAGHQLMPYTVPQSRSKGTAKSGLGRGELPKDDPRSLMTWNS